MKKTDLIWPLLILLISSPTWAQEFPTTLYCVSWMNLKTEIHQVKIDEWASAHISYTQDHEWNFEADVFEGRINYVTLKHLPTQAQSTNRSQLYNLSHLFAELEVNHENKMEKANLDCDLRK